MVSERLSSLTPSLTLEVTAKAKAMKAKGIDVIGFGAGEPDFDTPHHIKEALYSAVKDGFIYYTPASGIPELREAISKKLKRENGIGYQPEEIIATPGAKQAIFEAIMVLLNPGDEVLVPQPHWVSYMPIVKIAGGKGVPLPVRKEEGFKLQAEVIKERITPKTKLLILNTPNNPTGAVLERKDLERIAEACLENNLFVISDEIYEHIIYEARHTSIASLKEMKERTITVNGFSKAYSMTGWRLGYAAGPQHIIKLMSNLQGHSVSNATSFVQKAGIAALEGDQRCVRKMVEEFRKRRDRIVELLNGIGGVDCASPEGAFYVFPDFGAIEKSSLRLARHLLNEAKVAVIPGSAFGEAGEGFLRLSYATSMENIEKGIERIKKAVKELG
ncbi:MAG: pyridoxal phosphate-dependent aminotransferase [Candidatus Hydrothermarchaeales archaeon]